MLTFKSTHPNPSLKQGGERGIMLPPEPDPSLFEGGVGVGTFARSINRFLISSLLALSALFLLPRFTEAQEKLSFARIDSLSYQAYLGKDWKSVLEYSRLGFGSGYDYYYLRMRAGIAELIKFRPSRAATHFRKALDFNQDDPNALGYLYSSLLFSGDPAEARLLASDFSPSLKSRLGIPVRRLITSAFLESGYMVNSKAGEFADFRPDARLSNVKVAYVYLVPDYWYLSAGINMEAGKRFSAALSANILSFPAVQRFMIRNLDPVVRDVPFDQRAVYLSGTYYLGKGFNVSLAGQAMSCTIPWYYRVPTDTGDLYVPDASSYRDLALNASVSKRFPFFTAGLSADLNRFKKVWYRQASLDLNIYPAGNVNTYLSAGGTWLSDSNRIIAHAGAGRKLFRTVWLEGYYYFGKIINFSDNNAYVVFNNFDIISKRMGINLMTYCLLPHLDLALRYQYTLRTASWWIYESSLRLDDITKDYPVHSLIVGLTWRF